MVSKVKLSMRTDVRGGGKIIQKKPSTWLLEIPPGSSNKYRLAQLVDYKGLSRGKFPWRPPLNLNLRARASAKGTPGTWGFGFWNDPFGMTLVKGTEVRLPTLPNTAWFFFASPQNYLSLRDDLPGYGQMAATFRSPGKLPLRLIVSLLLIPMIILPPVARWMRRLVRSYVHQDTVEFNIDPTEWHQYEIEWRQNGVVFLLDGQILNKVKVHPRGPLGLVVWIDNQYAGWSPEGRLRYGTLANDQAAWIELEDLNLGFA